MSVERRFASALIASSLLGCGFMIKPGAGVDDREQPVVRIAAVDPIVVTAAGFGPREQVRVVVYGASRGERAAVADVRGGFKVVFRRIAPGRCGAVTVRAFGARNHRASAMRGPRPGCLGPPVPAGIR